METAVLFGMSKEVLLALVTGVCMVAALVLFVRSVLAGKSKPYLWAWLIRIGLCAVAFVSQFAGGATYSLVLSGGQLLAGFIIIGTLVYMRPQMGQLDRMDRSGIVLAIGGVVVWVVSGNPLFGLLGTLLADSAATAMGIRASLAKDSAESLSFWMCSLVAATATLLATRSTALVIMLAPLFSTCNALANIGTILLVRRRTRRVALPIAEAA